MPTYEYQCKKCGNIVSELQSMSDPPLTLCPACNTESLARIMGTGGGLIFKGSGFYLTDYKKGSSSPAATPAPKKPDPPAAPSAPSTGSTGQK